MDNLLANLQKSFSGLGNDKSDLLKGQQISQEKINQLLEMSTEALLCGPSCQKQKISDELRQKYLDAETNMQTAPIKLEQTKRNYYVYTEGRPYYDNMREDELKKKAEKVSTMLTENFNDELTNANTMNSYLNTALTNSQYTKDLLQKYLDENAEFELQLKERKGDILTNDRKTYYETDALNRLQLWYSFLWYIYYLLVVIVVLAFIFSPSEVSRVKKLVVTVLLVFYPYYIDSVVNWIYGLFKGVANRMPKNVYNNL